MIRSFDPAYVAVTHDVVTMADGAALVDARDECHGPFAGDAPAWPVIRVEVNHHSVTTAAGAVEDQPFVTGRATDDDSVSGRNGVGNIGHRRGPKVGLPSAPEAEAI